MAKVLIAGDSFTLVSSVKLQELLNLKKFNKQDLELKDEKGQNTIFAVDVAVGSKPFVSENGVVFTSADNEGNASATFLFDETSLVYEKQREAVSDQIGKALLKLNQLEAVLDTRLTAFNEAIAEIESSIQ